MVWRISLLIIFCLSSLVLASCIAPQSAAPSVMPSEAPIATSLPPTELQFDVSEELLIIQPTLAPTATLGLIGMAVEQATASIDGAEQVFWGLFIEDWVNLGISLLIVILALTLIAGVFIAVLRILARQTSTPYDDFFIKSNQRYLRWLFGLIGLNIAVKRLQFLSPVFKQMLSQIFYALIMVIIVISLWKLIDCYVLWYREKAEERGEKEQKEAILLLIERALRGLLVLIGSIVILDHMGVNITALVTALGIGGLALSLAAQDSIANMISGVMILIDQPFRVGDRIEIQELSTWGDVVDIGLRSTRIRTLDNRMVIVPNSSISNNQVVNYTFPDPRYRIQTEIGVAYGSDLRQVREVIKKALQGIEGVLQDKPVDVLFLEFGDSAMILRVRWWIESYVDARRTADKVNEAIYKGLEQAKIELPAPMMSVELKQKNSSAKGNSS